MTNKKIIEKIKELSDKMEEGFELTLKEKSEPTPTFLEPFCMTKLTEIHLTSSLGTLLHLKIFHDIKDKGNNQLAKGALKIIETFTTTFNQQ